MVRAVLILLRGAGFGFLSGMAAGAAYGVFVAVISNDPAGLLVGPVLGGMFGLVIGLAVGLVAGALLALVSAGLHDEAEARVAGAIAAAVAPVLLLLVFPALATYAFGLLVWFLPVCAAIGAGVGRVVVFGDHRV